MEPERKIEKLLRAYAQKRRADAGGPLKLHPGTRRLLQGEVSRRTNEPEAEGASLSLLQLFRQQWAFLLGFAFMIFLGATLLLPTLRSAKREAQSISTMNNLHQIGTAAEIVAGENNGRLPLTLDALTNEFLSPQVLTDPASGKRFVYAAAGDNLNELQSNNILAYSPLSRDGSAVLFADGRVEFANRARFAELTNQKIVQFALADKSGSGQTARISYAAAAAAPPAQLPATGETRGQPGIHGSQLFVQNGAASGQQNRYRNDAVSAQSTPVLQTFQLLQNGNVLSVVDQDGSVYQGSVQVAAVMKQTEEATVEAPAKAAESNKDGTKLDHPAGIQQQSFQNYVFRVAGINRTLKQNVVFSGSLETAPEGQQTFGGIGGGGGGGMGGAIEPAETNSQATANRQQGVLPNLRVVGTAVIGPTNHISVNAVPVTP